MTESIYNSFIQTKNDSTIPILTNGKTVESRYNPQNDALRTLESYSQGNFFIVIGIASGILISLLKEKFSFAKIICIEKSQNDITFLNQLELVDDLSKSQNIIFTDIENLQTVIEQNYIPSFYGNLQIIEQRGWILENHDATKQIQQKIQNALFTITKDFNQNINYKSDGIVVLDYSFDAKALPYSITSDIIESNQSILKYSIIKSNTLIFNKFLNR